MSVNIHPFTEVRPMVYAYHTPGVTYHEGWTKIGYTATQTVAERIKQQTHTAGIHSEIDWCDHARYKDAIGKYFTDKHFHAFLEGEKNIERENGTEWFRIDGKTSLYYFNQFANKSNEGQLKGCSYTLRSEQEKAVSDTIDCFKAGGRQFLWNAKPRFGKTLTAYELIQRMGFKNVLIVTNRPSISNSWLDDFIRFVAGKGKYLFVSETDALAGKPGVYSREEYTKQISMAHPYGMIAFESLQGLKGSRYFGGEYDKLRWMSAKDSDFRFDLLIVDESQEGVDTHRTDKAFDNIKRDHTLYLSGTPFKQLAGGQFSASEIFNWSYADEQKAKAEWNDPEQNDPYEELPSMAMYTYQLSNMIREQVQKGLVLTDDGEAADYAFDLNEFFATNENGRFTHEEDVKRFLAALKTQEKYPFSTPELRGELRHTLWLLNRVASAKALCRLLKEDEIFSEYEIVLAAGDGAVDDEKQRDAAFDRVKKAIREHDKTITLSVGQLTVGVTIPEWSGVMMLCNLSSPSGYFQAAFRAQNPCMYHENDKDWMKKTAYVFDFDPARTLMIYDEFANNLRVDGGTGSDRGEHIRELLNFFPVLGEDTEGSMVELDAVQVLSIPRRLKSTEVVRRGFMCNYLFQNIANVFGMTGPVADILMKLPLAHEEPASRSSSESLTKLEEVHVDENGEVEVPAEIVIGTTQDLFGDKIYADIAKAVEEPLAKFNKDLPIAEVKEKLDQLMDTVVEAVKTQMIDPAAQNAGIGKAAVNRTEKAVTKEIQTEMEHHQDDLQHKAKLAEIDRSKALEVAITEDEKQQAEEDYQSAITQATEEFTKSVHETTQKIIEETPKKVVEHVEKEKAEAKKRSIEDDVRAHLRGFARTIPSFIMAYGDGNLKLSNFEEHAEEDVFKDVTSITLEEFRFLRDGGDYTDRETGETKHFDGQLFDEVVFDDSVTEFMNKKQDLADYFNEEHDEDIFDYIPPQRTNQIFTPKWVVKKMVDELEENNPGCFDNPEHTFADLYMKSGLYITEIVKRLYHSEAIKRFYPDDDERIRHILEEQVYGMAPTRIIYLIATNYILGFDEDLKVNTHHFVQADAAEAAKKGRLPELVDQCF